jgi:hypothetical protein
MTKRTIEERSPSPLKEWEAGPRMPDIDGGAATSGRNNGAAAERNNGTATSGRNNGAATSGRNNGAAAGGSLRRSAGYCSPTSRQPTPTATVVDVLNTQAQPRSPNNNSPEPQGQFFEELLPESQGPTEEREKESQVEKIMRFRRQLDEERKVERLKQVEESLHKRNAEDEEYDRRKLLAKKALQVNPPSSPESGFSIAPPILPGRFWGNRKHKATKIGVAPDGHHEFDEKFTEVLTILHEKEKAVAKLSYEKYKQRKKEEELQMMDKKRKAEGDEEKDGNQKDPHQGNGGDKDPGHGNGGGSSSKGNGGYPGSSSHGNGGGSGSKGNGGYQGGAAGGSYSQGR